MSFSWLDERRREERRQRLGCPFPKPRGRAPKGANGLPMTWNTELGSWYDEELCGSLEQTREIHNELCPAYPVASAVQSDDGRSAENELRKLQDAAIRLLGCRALYEEGDDSDDYRVARDATAHAVQNLAACAHSQLLGSRPSDALLVSGVAFGSLPNRQAVPFVMPTQPPTQQQQPLPRITQKTRVLFTLPQSSPPPNPVSLLGPSEGEARGLGWRCR